MSHKIGSGSRTGPEKSAVDLSKLLGYYLTCVEEEDRRSLQLSADPKYRQFVTPPGQPGALFLGEAEIDWSPSLEPTFRNSRAVDFRIIEPRVLLMVTA